MLSKYFHLVVYPDSAPKNWESILEELRIPCIISPLHNKDLDVNNNLKNSHYHIILMFDSVKSVSKINEIIDIFGGINCELIRCLSLKGYARYLCNLDNLEKPQYNPHNVRSLNGADYWRLI